jgi:putative endonuclease
MKTYTIYILHCYDNSYYVEMTSDFTKRIWQHATAYYPNAYTAKRRPVTCIYTELFGIASIVRRRELQLKRCLQEKSMH